MGPLSLKQEPIPKVFVTNLERKYLLKHASEVDIECAKSRVKWHVINTKCAEDIFGKSYLDRKGQNFKKMITKPPPRWRIGTLQ